MDVTFLLDVSGKVLLISFPLEAEKSTDGRKSVFEIFKSFSEIWSSFLLFAISGYYL